MHKILAVIKPSSIACSEILSFSNDDQAGRYYTEVTVGTEGGTVTLNYDAGDIPDRFQIEYDGVIVADSKLVGDYLTGNPPNADTALWEGGAGSGQFVGKVYNNLPNYIWNGVTFIADGNTTDNTVTQSDVADFGSTSGTGSISFTKPAGAPTTMTIITTAFPSNTGFSFTPSCPTSLTAFTVNTETDSCVGSAASYPVTYYHDGANSYPTLGDTIYSDALGNNPVVSGNFVMSSPAGVTTDVNGISIAFSCF